jgi:hypothetical protein
MASKLISKSRKDDALDPAPANAMPCITRTNFRLKVVDWQSTPPAPPDCQRRFPAQVPIWAQWRLANRYRITDPMDHLAAVL